MGVFPHYYKHFFQNRAFWRNFAHIYMWPERADHIILFALI